MNPAEVATALVVERTLSTSPAYRKVDDALYVIKQGSAYVMLSIVPGNARKSARWKRSEMTAVNSSSTARTTALRVGKRR